MNWRGREEERCSVSNRSRSGRGGARRGWRRARGQSVGEEEDGELGEGRRRPWGRAAVTSGKGGGDGGARRRRGGRQTQLGEGRRRRNRAGTGGGDDETVRGQAASTAALHVREEDDDLGGSRRARGAWGRAAPAAVMWAACERRTEAEMAGEWKNSTACRCPRGKRTTKT